jgi:hypothetical protein
MWDPRDGDGSCSDGNRYSHPSAPARAPGCVVARERLGAMHPVVGSHRSHPQPRVTGAANKAVECFACRSLALSLGHSAAGPGELEGAFKRLQTPRRGHARVPSIRSQATQYPGRCLQPPRSTRLLHNLPRCPVRPTSAEASDRVPWTRPENAPIGGAVIAHCRLRRFRAAPLEVVQDTRALDSPSTLKSPPGTRRPGIETSGNAMIDGIAIVMVPLICRVGCFRRYRPDEGIGDPATCMGTARSKRSARNTNKKQNS